MFRPNCAPAWEYVAMPLGSSSATPVINPGPTRAKGCSLIRTHADFQHLRNAAKTSESSLRLLQFTDHQARLLAARRDILDNPTFLPYFRAAGREGSMSSILLWLPFILNLVAWMLFFLLWRQLSRRHFSHHRKNQEEQISHLQIQTSLLRRIAAALENHKHSDN
jgi:hypothetical protein